MKPANNRRKLFNRLRDEMATDRAKHTILPPSKFGLVQITRQRVRPEMNVETVEKCPVCEGTGEIKPSILFIDELENNVRYLLQEQNERNLKIVLHPYLYAFLAKGFYSLRWKWYFKYKRWIKMLPDNSYHMLEYHFFNKNNDELKM